MSSCFVGVDVVRNSILNSNLGLGALNQQMFTAPAPWSWFLEVENRYGR
jgi:hypothetical protein